MEAGVHSPGGGSDEDELWEPCAHARNLGCCIEYIKLYNKW